MTFFVRHQTWINANQRGLYLTNQLKYDETLQKILTSSSFDLHGTVEYLDKTQRPSSTKAQSTH